MSQEVFGKHRSGFTMIEFIVVMSIFVISVSSVLPFLDSFHQSERVGTTIMETVDTLRRGQHRAMTSQRGLGWGVLFQTGSFILYAGDSYAARHQEFDEVHTAPSAHVFSGSGEVIFTQYTGKPNAPASIFITNTNVNQQGSVTINSVGNITRILPTMN